ncbi:sugar ABC transporter substrate-binding protein [Bradyrhizobium genomosp. I (2014)]|uniref:sugar ABC transporter substrate-binding protein n=1 Tax=Bradyrhizobium genomosp. I (2014) TaxID=2683269 RepID=UPI0004B2E378|nr:sugar ABC transporter substrate-binding protein [Bradyrhizobium sp. CCBAU 43298]
MRCLLILLLGAMLSVLHAVQAQQGAPGITKPVILPAYDPNAPRCTKPADLTRVLAFAQDNERKFMQGVAQGLEQAARDRGMDYQLAQAGNDARRMNQQIAALREAKVGALVASPVNPLTLAPALQQVIWTGAYVGTVVPPPATTILNAPQYLTGKVLADEAASYIKARLNGRAKVVLLTHDSLQFLAPRFTAMRDTVRSLPGVTIVADISPLTVDEAGGASMMRTILLANSDVDVVLGADTVVLGALAAMREAGRVRDDQFFGGIDGEPAAVAEIKRGGPYKASVSLASPIFGYAMGQHAADWLDGKSIPQAMDILPKALTLQNLAQYQSDIADPAAVYNDPKRRDSYLKMYGNICFDTRDQYLNFPWSSERKN